MFLGQLTSTTARAARSPSHPEGAEKVLSCGPGIGWRLRRLQSASRCARSRSDLFRRAVRAGYWLLPQHKRGSRMQMSCSTLAVCGNPVRELRGNRYDPWKARRTSPSDLELCSVPPGQDESQHQRGGKSASRPCANSLKSPIGVIEYQLHGSSIASGLSIISVSQVESSRAAPSTTTSQTYGQ